MVKNSERYDHILDEFANLKDKVERNATQPTLNEISTLCSNNQKSTKHIEEELYKHHQQANAMHTDETHGRTSMTADMKEIRNTLMNSSMEQSSISRSIRGISDILHDLDRRETRTSVEQLEQGLQIRLGFRECTEYLKMASKHAIQQREQEQRTEDHISICKTKFKDMLEWYVRLLIEYESK